MPSVDKKRITLEHELTFPESSDFRSKKLPVKLVDITRLSEEQLPLMNSTPGIEEKRLRIKAKKKFVL